MSNPLTHAEVTAALRELTSNCKTNWCKFCATQKAAADLIESLIAENARLKGESK